MQVAPKRFVGHWFGKSQGARARHSRPWRPGLETLEDRSLMSFTDLGGINLNNLPMIQQVVSAGSFSYNASNRSVTVSGADAYDDRVKLTIDARGTFSAADDMLGISITNIGTPLSAQYRVSDVSRVFVSVLGGNDTVDNQSSMRMTAYGGPGIDILLGGSADDALLGGPDNDFLDGRRGGDSIWGEGGVDALFGDDGIDMILGGTETDYLFGGNDDDTLYGEGGNDRLYGGAGRDRLVDPLGSNTFYNDFGPDNSVSASGFQAFDWFDRNLRNADLRSQVRLLYRNGLLERNDMFVVYAGIASDNYVSSTEFADLKTVAATPRLNTSADVRFFMNKIANGDRANQRYRGGALGNLAAGSSGDRLHKLVDKWFKGGDLPAISGSGAHYEYVYGNLFVGGPNHTDVDQGSTGDCYFLATLGETAFRSQSTIQRMFASNGDGTFLVQFFRGGTPQFVTVNRFLPADGRGNPLYAGWGSANGTSNAHDDPNNELWVALAEKAYAQVNESGWIGQDGTNSYAGIDSGWPSNAFAHITGRTGNNSSLSNSGIINAFGAGKAITLTTKASGTTNNVVSNHVYMLVGYNSGTGRFHLFNPHGFVTGGTTELFLTWSQIVANFRESTSVML